MKLNEKFIEKDIVYEYTSGIDKYYKKKSLIRMVVIKYNPDNRKGKAISQILDGIRRLL